MTFVFIILITLSVALGATFIVLAFLKRKKKINFPKSKAKTTRTILNEAGEIPQLTENNERKEENVAELSEVEESILPDPDTGGNSTLDIDTD